MGGGGQDKKKIGAVCTRGGCGWLWLVLGVVVVVVGTGVSSRGRPTGCFTHGKPPFTATQSPQL